MAYIRLGNLKTREIEKHLGVEFSKKDFEFLDSSRVDKISELGNKDYKIASDEWHGFDLPRKNIHCGSKSLSVKIIAILSEYMIDGKFENGSSIVITNDVSEEEIFGYYEKKEMLEKNLEIYIGEETYKDNSYSVTRFYLKAKETESNIFLQELEVKKEIEGSKILKVPNLQKVKLDSSGEELKLIRKKKTEDNIYKIEDMFKVNNIKKWEGQVISEDFF